jgi:hypothetical protein
MRAGYSTATVGPRINISPLGLIYLIVGAIVAATPHHYFANLGEPRSRPFPLRGAAPAAASAGFRRSSTLG